jgi:hypothetical protein
LTASAACPSLLLLLLLLLLASAAPPSSSPLLLLLPHRAMLSTLPHTHACAARLAQGGKALPRCCCCCCCCCWEAAVLQAQLRACFKAARVEGVCSSPSAER